MTYQYRSGFSIPSVPAETAAEELNRIREEAGQLTTEAVIEAARPDDAPLHNAFEWDDSVAAEEYRKAQARKLLKGIVIVVENHEPTPMHFHITTEDGGRYEPAAHLMTDKDLFNSALSELQSKVTAAQRAVDQLVTLGSGSLSARKLKRAKSAKQHMQAAAEEVAALS